MSFKVRYPRQNVIFEMPKPTALKTIDDAETPLATFAKASPTLARSSAACV